MTEDATPATMPAVVLHEEGGPEVLRVEQVPVPQPAPGEVRVQLRRASLNHLDLWIRKGLPSVPKPRIMGADGMGMVDAAGDGAEIDLGTRVLLDPSVTCGTCRACVDGDSVMCERFSVLGEHRSGTHAGWVCIPAVNAHRVPVHLTDDEAAALPLTWCTAWRMIVGRAQARPGEWMLVWGASAGVGSAALSIARALGVRTIATTRSSGKVDLLRELGAHEVVVTGDDMAGAIEVVRNATNDRGVDVVFDHLGQASWKPSLQSLARGGRYVTCGATTGANPPAAITRIFWNQLSILGSTMATKREFADMLRFVDMHGLRPRVDRVFELKDAADAHAWLEGSTHVGKVVLRISD